MRVIVPVLQALAVTVVSFFLIDRAIAAGFPHFERLRSNFSSAYLARELRTIAPGRPVVVLGDSVLWGYGIPSADAAISRIRARRPGWVNLAYPGGSPVNTLAMLHLLAAAGVEPRLVVFNVNQKTFSSEDSAYAKLHPAVEELAWPALPAAQRADLTPTLSEASDARLDRALGRFWLFYGMRADIRDALFDDSDAAHRLRDVVETASGAAAETAAAHVPKPEDFEGTYDLTPLAADNVAYRALIADAAFVRDHHIPALAILTPTNHALLHDYIDDPGYRANVQTTRRVLERAGVRVVDLDAAFRAGEFIDNDHLTVAGNARLAPIIDAAAAKAEAAP